MSSAHQFAIGGLMRCCVQTIELRAQQGPPKLLETMPCSWCGSSVVYDVDHWRWNREAESEVPHE